MDGRSVVSILLQTRLTHCGILSACWRGVQHRSTGAQQSSGGRCQIRDSLDELPAPSKDWDLVLNRFLDRVKSVDKWKLVHRAELDSWINDQCNSVFAGDSLPCWARKPLAYSRRGTHVQRCSHGCMWTRPVKRRHNERSRTARSAATRGSWLQRRPGVRVHQFQGVLCDHPIDRLASGGL